MCPACTTIAALVVAGATSTGGLAAFVAKKRGAGRVPEVSPNQIRQENEP